MRTVNRVAIVVKPKTPYYDWANGFDDGGPTLDPTGEENGQLMFLLPECYDYGEVRRFVADNCMVIFEEMLTSWMRKPATWPERDIATFGQWFDYEILDPVFDLGNDEIVSE